MKRVHTFARALFVLTLGWFLAFANGNLHAQLNLSPPANVTARAGERIVIPLNLGNPNAAPIDAFGLRFNFPEALLEFVMVDKAGTLTASWIQVSGNLTATGQITIGGFNTAVTTSSGVLVNVVFAVKANAVGQGALALTNFSDDLADATTTDGIFVISERIPCEGQALFVAPQDGGLGQLITARNRDTVHVDVRVQENSTPIGAFGFAVEVDPHQLAFLSAQRGDLTAGFVDMSAQEQPAGSGRLICGGYGASRIPANSSGTLIRLSFKVSCEEGDTSAIALGGPVDDVAGFETCSNEFACEGCKRDGDVNGDRHLTPGDAQCAFRIFLNGQELPADCDNPNFDCELVAADANCSLSVTPADALAIFERALLNLLPEECFAQPGLARTASQAEPYQLALHHLSSAHSQANKFVKFSLNVERAEGLSAFGLQLKFPAEKLEFVGIERGALTADWLALDGQANAMGLLTIGGFHNQPVAKGANGELLRIVFKAGDRAVDAGELALLDLVDDLSGAMIKTESAGTSSPAVVPSAFKLHQSFPNPARAGKSGSATLIRFDLPGTAAVKVELAIYNIAGQLVRRLVSATRPPGAYEISWDGRDEKGRFVPSGTYWYQIKAGNFAASRRLAVVR